jgi:hypothetical protein
MGRGSKSLDKLTTPSKAEGPQEYYLYFEDFKPKPDKEFGRQPKFCKATTSDSRFPVLRNLPQGPTGSAHGLARFLFPDWGRFLII